MKTMLETLHTIQSPIRSASMPPCEPDAPKCPGSRWPFLSGNVLFQIGLVLVALFIVPFISSCSDSTSPTGQGRIVIRMTDAPATYDHVNIVVHRVEIHQSGADSTTGWREVNTTATVYDLIALKNGASIVLGNAVTAVGSYTQIRMVLGAGNTVVVNGIVYPLTVPSGFQTGIKINHGFTITEAGTLELMLDFDAENSIQQTGINEYKLQPVIHVKP